MTPKEKANQLVDKYLDEITVLITEETKDCALIAVDEIIQFMKLEDEDSGTCHNANSKWMNYWLDVKREIEAL